MRNMMKKVVAILLTATMIMGTTVQLYAGEQEKTADDFHRVKLTFEDETDASRFSGSYWSVKEGVLKEGMAWGTTYLTELLPLDENLTVSFDVYIDYTGVWADSFIGFGFLNADQTAGTFGWIQRTQYGDLLTWRKNGVDGPTSNTGVGDQILCNANAVSEGTTIYGGVHKVKLVLADGVITTYVDGVEKKNCTNGKSVTCDNAEGYFTLRATNTSAYIDNLKIVKTEVSDDYSETFADLSTFDKSGSVSVDTTNKKFVGSSWSGVAYKLPAENYRLDMKFKLNAECNSANENRLYFGMPTTSTANGAGGYLLHFYNNTTWVFDNSVVRSGWYDNNAIISKFTNKTNFQNDGEEHTLTLCVYENQFYMLIDGMFFTYGDENIYTATNDFGASYLNFIGHNWEVSQFDITCFGGFADVASAHFAGVCSVYEAVEELDETLYSAYAWSTVEGIRDEYLHKMDAVKDGSNAATVTALGADAVTKINAVPTKAIVEEDVVGENQVLIGYIVSGGSYNGGLYNFEVGDELPEGDDITLEPVVVTMQMETGAAIRLREGAGIRWITNIPKADYEKLTALGVTFGTRITSVGSDKHVDIELEQGLNTESDAYYYTAALVNIKEENYTRAYNGCGYATVTYADGTTDTKKAVGSNNQRTYKYLVSKAYGDVSETQTGEYQTAVQKDGKTVYSPYTTTQFAFIENVFESIQASQTTGDGTGAQIHILNVNDGEEVVAVDGKGGALAALLKYNGKNILIDAARPQTREIVANYLRAQGVERLDYVISTHSHVDHIGAMTYIFENFDVGTLIYKEPDWSAIKDSETNQPLCAAMLDAATAKVNSDGTKVNLVQPAEEGYKVSLGEDTYFQIFNCTTMYETKAKDDLNYYSLEVYFVSGTAKAFFGGDAVGVTHNEGMLEHLDKVDVYQAQHHGQGTPYSSNELLEVLQPKATVATTLWASPVITDTQERCGKYGRYYVTASDGHLVFENANGYFELKGDAEDRWANEPKVRITGTELTFDGSKRTSADGNAVSGKRYVVPGRTTGTAMVLKAPENMTQPAMINFDKGMMLYADVEGLRFRIVLNDRVLYDSNVSGLDGDNIELAFSVNAGDKVYFIAEGTTQTVHMPLSLTIDGKYFCVDHADNVNPAQGNNFVSKDFFGGQSEKGSYYTCEELLDYMSVTVTEVQ